MNNSTIVKLFLLTFMVITIGTGIMFLSMFIAFDEKLDVSMVIPSGYDMEFDDVKMNFEGIDESLVIKEVEVKIEFWMNEGMKAEIDFSHSDWDASLSYMNVESTYVMYISPDKGYLDFTVDSDDRYVLKIINKGTQDLEITGTFEIAKKIDHVVSILIQFIFGILLFIGYRFEKQSKVFSNTIFGAEE